MLLSECFECLADIRSLKTTRFMYVAASYQYTQTPAAPSKSIETAELPLFSVVRSAQLPSTC